ADGHATGRDHREHRDAGGQQDQRVPGRVGGVDERLTVLVDRVTQSGVDAGEIGRRVVGQGRVDGQLDRVDVGTAIVLRADLLVRGEPAVRVVDRVLDL